MLELMDTRQGTENQHSYSNGNTLPYTGFPFGMNFFVPQTKHTNGSWFFHPRDRVFQGFRLTHQPSPWMGDFSHLLLTPLSGAFQNADIYHYQSSYRPESAIYQPHYLQITQARYQIKNELVPTTYGAILRSNYRDSNLPGLSLHLPGKGEISLDSNKKQISGYVSNFAGCEDPNFKMYFIMTFNHPIDQEHTGFFQGDNPFTPALSASGEDQHFLIRFLLNQEEPLETRLATSFISSDQAEWNLNQELSPFSFDTLQKQAADAWEYYLNKIEVKNGDFSAVKTFYHCMYRMFLFPQKFYEINQQGEPIHYDTTSKRVKTGVLYTNNGFWDTFRTVYPLYSLLIPDEYEEMLRGFLNSYRETGFLPKWLSPDERGLMPGTLIDAVIADASQKGIARDLIPELFEAMVKTASTVSSKPTYGRQGIEDYDTYGYIPSNHHESVNHTLDYAYSDFCISRVAKELGNKEIEQMFEKRAYNYLNIFHEETGFMRAKDKQGRVEEPFNCFSWGQDYAEGSAWQSSFAVFHDFAGLINAYGGNKPFREKLVQLCNQEPIFETKGYGFEIHEMSEMAAIDFGQVAISNQPSFHLPYLFTYAGDPASSQVLLKQLMTQLFTSSPTGYPGDEDNGSMSGWFIFNSMGFYPVCPGTGEYVIGIPIFDSITIHLPNDKKIEISTKFNQPPFNFVHQVTVNNATYNKLTLEHDLLIKGCTIDFQLGIVPPNKEYAETDLPYSLSTDSAASEYKSNV